jgi:capsular exopolysaccharide synthesis family protein
MTRDYRLRKGREAALGKFYDAMQRVSPPDAKEASQSKPTKPQLPELDEALLKPEGSGDKDHVAVSPEDRPMSFETAVVSSQLGVPELDDLISDVGSEQPAEPVLRVVDPVADSSPVSHEKRSAFAPMRRLRTDVFRRPIEAAYERIIQRLFAYRRTPRESIILVTSAVSGEGTSTVARNIALALAQHRAERVLLIDANLRTPSQHKAFGLECPDGLGDVLLGPTVLTSAVQDDVVPGLSLLASGLAMESPAQLLTVASLHSVIMALLSLYDWIIIDSPPATTYPDVATIAAAAGGAILVVEAEKTRKEVVEEAKRVLDVSGVDLLGAVLNRRRYHIPNAIYKRL